MLVAWQTMINSHINSTLRMTRFITLLLPLLFTTSLFGAQEFAVSDGDTVKVKISARELTRISVDGEGRLDKVWGAPGVLDIQPDKEQGEIFIRPTSSAPPALSFFVRDDSGATYTIVAQQYEVPAQTIILRSDAPRKVTEQNPQQASLPFVDKIKELMEGMVLAETIGGYRLEDMQESIPLWQETHIVLRRVYKSRDLTGEVYSIENRTDQTVTFHEREFMNFRGRTQAVALERLSLASNETAFLYIVRKGGA